MLSTSSKEQAKCVFKLILKADKLTHDEPAHRRLPRVRRRRRGDVRHDREGDGRAWVFYTKLASHQATKLATKPSALNPPSQKPPFQKPLSQAYEASKILLTKKRSNRRGG